MLTESELLSVLVKATSLVKANEAISELESRYGYRWRAVGDRENNYGLINIGSDPGFALVERVTNAIDAVIEAEAAERLLTDRDHGDAPATPREAVEQWLAVPSGRVRNLEITMRQELADRVVVSLEDGKRVREPTIVIRDYGIGLTNELIPRTILGLGEGNKIDKPYLAGAYGQGGSTALAFSPNGTVLMSRRRPTLLSATEPDRVAVTFARFRDLDPRKNKNGRYEYLTNGTNEIATLDPIDAGDFSPGTKVVHFEMEIGQYAAQMTQLTGSFWWLLQNALFDPVLPLWVEERRAKYARDGKPIRRTIAGNHSRLFEDARDKVEHHDSIDINVEHSGGPSRVTVHYWVMKEAEGDRTSPVDSYVDRYHPVTYTYYGQTHGRDDRRFVSDRLSLPYLAKYLILQVELDGLSAQGRRNLLSTTRDRLKESGLYIEMREQISTALSHDPELIRLNDQRKESLLSQHSDSERERMRQRFARLMERLLAGKDAAAGEKSPGGDRGRRDTPQPPPKPQEPLPTQEEPSFIRIANVRTPIPIRVDRTALIALESDAPDGYLTLHAHANLVVASEPEGGVKQLSTSDFRGGRSRLVIAGGDSAQPGDQGTLTVFLFTPTKHQFRASVAYKIENPKEKGDMSHDGKAHVKTPEPVPIYRNSWGPLDWDETNVAEVREDQQETRILVNMDNRHIRGLLEAGGYREQGLARMKNNYLLYVAFYSWLQDREIKADERLQKYGAEFEDYQAKEMDRVAQTVVHSIAAEGRMEE